jgi:hypothetical protein
VTLVPIQTIRETVPSEKSTPRGCALAQQDLCLRGLLLLGFLGIAMRGWVALRCYGSNDMSTWTGFAEEISRTSLGTQYDVDPFFNHPPLMGLMAAALHYVAGKIGERFDVLFKLPMILADLISAGLVYHFWKRRNREQAALAFTLFCWNPTSFLVTAYHGNTDSLCAAFALLAAVLVEANSAFWGGVALAASINVKLIPVMLIPVLLSCLRSWRKVLHFSLGLSLGVIPFLPIVYWHWRGFREHVLGYRPFTGEWGITGLLGTLNANANFAPVGVALNDFWIDWGPYIILLLPVALGVVNLLHRHRRWRATQIAAATFCAFLAFTPGWGIQYIVYPVPLLFVANRNRAVEYSMMAGLYAGVVYFCLWTGDRPFYSSFWDGQPLGGKLLGYLAWIVIARSLFDVLRTAKPTSEVHA